ncbi:MAG TPA: hypothetical protein PKA88_07130 [Polyangiaceae bacterium]|nr:hypothetical protein [Polyangiaceae bacterium]
MRKPIVLVPLFLIAATGCYAPVEEASTQAAAPISYSGYSSGDSVCKAGDVYLLIDDIYGDEWKATGYFESEPIAGKRYRSTSRLEGRLTDGLLVLRDNATLEADALPWGMSWCSGQANYRLNLGEKPSLVGNFSSTNCGCDVAVSMNGQ